LCDLNRRPLPDLCRQAAVQVAVFSGVLEYVADLSSVLRWLAPETDFIIASYNCVPTSDTSTGRLLKAASRLSAGWVNAFTDADFRICFEQASYETVNRVAVIGERDEYIYLFARV
jgi:hypothetical protein